MQRPVRVCVCCDKFKGSLSASEANDSVRRALESLFARSSQPLEVRTLAFADGGEGFVDALREPLSLTVEQLNVAGPLGCDEASRVDAMFGWNATRREAVIEMAEAAGLWRVPESQRDPLKTTTHGVGELLGHVYSLGCRRILVGVGGSATNDLGLGALHALGLRVFVRNDPEGEERELGVDEPVRGETLALISRLEAPKSRDGLLLGGASILVASDVTNPLVGARGATMVFGSQKGGSAETLATLETHMRRLAPMLDRVSGRRTTTGNGATDHSTVAELQPLEDVSGAGAAGGLAGGLVAGLKAELRPGFDLLSEVYELGDVVRWSDLVISGEGGFDSTTADGKVVSGVARLCNAIGRPCVVVCGVAEENLSTDAQHQHTFTVDQVHSMSSEFALDVCLDNAQGTLELLVERRAARMPVIGPLVGGE